MGRYSEIACLCLLVNLLAVRALEDPDLIRHCGDAKALALGLSPSKGYEASNVNLHNIHHHPEIKYESYSHSPSHGFAQSGQINQQSFNHHSPSGNFHYSGGGYQHQDQQQGYHVSAGLSNFGTQKSAYNQKNFKYQSIPHVNYHLPLPPQHYSTLAPLLSYAEPNPKYVTKLSHIPSFSIYNSKSSASASSFAEKNSFSSKHVSSNPGISLQAAYIPSKVITVSHQPIQHSYSTFKPVSQSVIAYAPSYSSHHSGSSENHASYLNSQSSESSGKSDLTHSSPLIYNTPSVSYTSTNHNSGSAENHKYASSYFNSESSDSSSGKSSLTYSSPVIYSAPSVTYTSSNHNSGSAENQASFFNSQSSDSSAGKSGLSYSSPVTYSAPSVTYTSSNHNSGSAGNHKYASSFFKSQFADSSSEKSASHHATPIRTEIIHVIPEKSISSSSSEGHQSGSSDSNNHLSFTNGHNSVAQSTVSFSSNQHSGGQNLAHQKYHLETKPATVEYVSNSAEASQGLGLAAGQDSQGHNAGNNEGSQVVFASAPYHHSEEHNSEKSEHGKIKSSKYYDAHPHYVFEYGVHDPHSGDNKHQKEVRDGDTVKGEYSLLQPDGTTRTVKYEADWKTGFHATVTNSKKQ